MYFFSITSQINVIQLSGFILLIFIGWFCEFLFFFFRSCNRTFGLPEKPDTGMSNDDSYNCIFVLFSLLEDHFFLICYSIGFIILIFKEIKHFFFLSHPQKVLHYQYRMTETLFNFLILILLRNKENLLTYFIRRRFKYELSSRFWKDRRLVFCGSNIPSL